MNALEYGRSQTARYIQQENQLKKDLGDLGLGKYVTVSYPGIRNYSFTDRSLIDDAAKIAFSAFINCEKIDQLEVLRDLSPIFIDHHLKKMDEATGEEKRDRKLRVIAWYAMQSAIKSKITDIKEGRR